MDDAEFQLLRMEFFYDPNTRDLLPRFVRDNLNGDGIWAYLKDFHTGSGSYTARRKHVAAQFEPILDFLSKNGAPVDAEVTASLDRYDEEGVSSAWQKALNRRKIDPEGAITSARTLLEEVCKHILEDAQEIPDEKWDLPKLYREASKNMNLAPSQHTEDVFKRILGGCQNVVENLGGLRNKISDAHGGGRRRVKPSDRHAALAVNLAGSMAQFLIETWAIQRGRMNSKEANTGEKQKPVSYKKILLSSRSDLASEIRHMKRIVDALAPDMAQRIETIWCDSKATSVYTVTVRKGWWTSELQWAVSDACYETGGHNGIYFDGDAPENTTLNPDWPGNTD